MPGILILNKIQALNIDSFLITNVKKLICYSIEYAYIQNLLKFIGICIYHLI